MIRVIYKERKKSKKLKSILINDSSIYVSIINYMSINDFDFNGDTKGKPYKKILVVQEDSDIRIEINFKNIKYLYITDDQKITRANFFE